MTTNDKLTRIGFGGLSYVYTALAFWKLNHFLQSYFLKVDINPSISDYAIPAIYLGLAVLTGWATLKNYGGGLWFAGATMLTAESLVVAVAVCTSYLQQETTHMLSYSLFLLIFLFLSRSLSDFPSAKARHLVK